MEFNVYLWALGIGFIWCYMFSTTKCPRCKHGSAQNCGIPTGFYIAKETLFIDLPPCENYGNFEENGSLTVGTSWHLHVCSLFSTCDRYELDCCMNVLSIGKTSKCSFFHWQSLFDARPFLARNWNRQRDSWQGFLEAVTQQPSRAAKFMKNKNDQLNSAAGFSTPEWTSLLSKDAT